MTSGPRLALVSRGDPLVPHLRAALAERYELTVDVDVELRGLRRAAVGAATVRPTWQRWADRYMKSNLGFATRSRLARRRLALPTSGYDVLIQVHGLFGTRDPRAMIYVDCTYRQAMRGWPAWTLGSEVARRRWLAAETAAYISARHVFAFTEVTRHSLCADYGVDPARVSVVGAGVNFTHPPAPGPRPEPVVLFVGKDFERKGGHVLLEAFARVREQVPGARLQIVGCTPSGALPAGVEVLGLITDRERMSRLYTEAAVFCLPSLFDPGPLVVLEAMAHGLPCVLSDEASHHVRDLVEDRGAGWSVDTGDAASLAHALLTLLQDALLARRMGSAARSATVTGFRWSDVVARMAPAIEAAGQDARSSRS